MKAGGTTVLMPVYNRIEFDGRVQRAASALSRDYEVTVLSVESEGAFSSPNYAVRTVDAGGGNAASRHLRFLAGVVREARRLRPQVIHAHDFFMAVPGLIAARASGARLVYDAHELIVPERGVPQPLRERIWYRLERPVVPRADLVIAANEFRANAMQEHYGLAALPVTVGNIPPPPRSTGAPSPGGELRGPRSEDGIVRLVYQGDMSLARGIRAFIEAVPELPPRFELLLVGGGPDLEALRGLTGSLGVGERVRFLGRVPNADLPAVLARCDIGLISYPQTGLNNLYCAPNKLYEYAQVGLPILARENPVLRDALGRYRIGVVTNDVVAGVLEIEEEMDALRSNIPAFLRDNRWEHESERLLAAYGEMLSESREAPRPHSPRSAAADAHAGAGRGG